jgi:Fe-S oxidoreductase
LKKDPKTICVCCPYCMTMFEDGLKDRNAEGKVQVLDLAEIVARALK